MANRSVLRRRAYCYIVRIAKQANWIPLIESDETLAGALGIHIDLIRSLKEGRCDPAPELVAKFREFVGPIILEDDIDSSLVKPFLTKE